MSKKWGVKMEIKINSISVVIKGKRIFSNITDTMNSGDMLSQVLLGVEKRRY